MTTDHVVPRRARPLEGLSALEWRVGFVTLLSIVHLVSWLGIRSRTKASEAGAGAITSEATERTDGSSPGRVVWLDELPAADRPSFALPTGYRLASRETSIVASSRSSPVPAARAGRTAMRPPVRIRTRSS